MLKFQVYTENLNNLQSRIADSVDRAEIAVAEQVLKDTAPFVPFLTGSLSGRARVDGKSVVYPGPYARYLYYGKVMIGHAPKQVTEKDLVFTTDYHKDAQAFWFEASKAQNMKKWERTAEKAVKRYRK